jgi:cold-inducible RNA-binding protein
MTNLFVGNLSFQTTDTDLEQAFGEYGPVEKARVVRDRDSGQSRGFGFVEMSNATEANAAVKSLDGRELNGRNLRVSEARPKEAGTGQHRYSGGSERSDRW